MKFKIVLTCLFLIDVLGKAAMIDKPREPVTINEFCFDLVINIILIFGLWNWI